MNNIFEYPIEGNEVLLKKKKLFKMMSERPVISSKKIAILSGSTIGHMKDILELFLLSYGISCEWYEGLYGQFYEDALFNKSLKEFNPDYVYIHTTMRNINTSVSSTGEYDLTENDYKRFESVWNSLRDLDCIIIQNNFELPPNRLNGNINAMETTSVIAHVDELNKKMIEYARDNQNFLINDIRYISACYGLEKWHNKQQWYAYKYAFDFNAIPLVCKNIADIIKASLGLSKKAIILDLDNTLWGGVVGDDGAEKLKIGGESSEGQAYWDFQQYLKELKLRGIVLCVCSKNNFDTARDAFFIRDMPLKFDDFTIFKANWDDKATNILQIAQEINLGVDSFVFVDDNPVERDYVKQVIKEISIVNTSNVEEFIDYIDKNGFFESIKITDDDLNRNVFYKQNIQRSQARSQYTNYAQYLESLEMTYTFEDFNDNNLERITQLINKTNQFNLTAKRMTQNEVKDVMNTEYLNIALKLCDKFGDNGLISVFIGAIKGDSLIIEVWLMSCRVFNRNVEQKLFERIVEYCEQNGISKIVGKYTPTSKNTLVEDLYPKMGFTYLDENLWVYNISAERSKQ